MSRSLPNRAPRAARRGLLAAALGAAVVLPLAPLPAFAQAAATARGLPDFSDLVDQVGPAVVNIRVLSAQKTSGGQAEAEENMQEFFRRYFGVPVPRPDQRRAPAPRGDDEESRQRGVGSGFIVGADGVVMTNAHVVEGADEVLVRLTDKREFKARVLGADKRTDVAVLKIEATGLPVVRTGDSARLKVGEWVIAIGSPFDLDNSVTAGIVSAKARDTGDFLPLIQTDVAINPGNSGGPLINMRGEVVGINSQIYSRSGGYMGISFAIPIDEALRVAEQLRAHGRVIRSRIGVQIDQVTKDVAESIGLGKPTGAFVRSVEAGGPAEKAGIEAGDIITRFDGKTVTRSADLPRIVAATKPGTKVSVQVFRRGGARDLTVTVVEMEPEQPRRAQAASEPKGRGAAPSAAAAALGLAYADLSEAQRKELKVKGGVRVDAADGPAARAGLREGDVILSIANQEVTDAKQVDALLAKLEKGKPVAVMFRRGDWAQYAVIRPGR